MTLDPGTLERVGKVKQAIKLSHLLPNLKEGANDCPRCVASGSRSGKNKLSVWENTHAKCWSTWCEWNRGLDVIGLYRFLNNLYDKGSFYVALKDLERKANITPPSPSDTPPSSSRALSECLRVYNQVLRLSKPAQDYLLGRGWDLGKLLELGVGYAPHNRILRDYNVDTKTLVKAELLDPETNQEYFSNRVVFPIRDINGNLVRLTGRYLGNIPEGKWKHTRGNMKEYLVLEEQLGTYIKNKTLILSEGFPDTYTLFEKGLPAVGTSGLRGICQHAHKFRGFEELVAIYDTDVHKEGHPQAGEYKSWAQVIPQLINLQYLLPELRIYLWFLPGEGKDTRGQLYTGVKDVNELVLATGINGPELMETIKGQRIDLIEYCINKWGQDLGYHPRLLKLCQSTGRGSSLLESHIPSHMGKLEYAMAVLEL